MSLKPFIEVVEISKDHSVSQEKVNHIRTDILYMVNAIDGQENRRADARNFAKKKADLKNGHDPKIDGADNERQPAFDIAYSGDAFRDLWRQLTLYGPNENQSSPFNSKAFYSSLGCMEEVY